MVARLTFEEVAPLVEDAVVRQVLLVIDAGDLAFVEDGGGVVEVVIGVDEADGGGNAVDLGCDVLQRLEVVIDETGAHEQVFRRVAGERELGEGDDVGALVAGLGDVVEDLVGVTFEVADSGVDLGEGYSDGFHGFRRRL